MMVTNKFITDKLSWYLYSSEFPRIVSDLEFEEEKEFKLSDYSEPGSSIKVYYEMSTRVKVL